MVNKNKSGVKKRKAEKYILCILIIFYISGIISGCYFISDTVENKMFTDYLNHDNGFKVVIFFILAFLLKYSGILSTGIYMLPYFAGVNNSASYFNIIADEQKINFETVIEVFKDTSVIMLLMLYIIIIILQVINRRYNIKKDIKYFTIYTSAALTILVLEFVLKNIIF